MRSLMRLAAFAAALGIASVGSVAPAVAHEHRGVGDRQFTVGWLNEPTYAGYINAVQFEAAHKGGGPITAANLKVVVLFGTKSSSTRSDLLALEPSDETPGTYTAAIIPTRPGTYTFHVTGSLAGGEKIDQFFTSGDKTFDDVAEPRAAEFPAKDPSVSQLAQRLDRADKDAKSAKSRANIAFVFGVVGLALGVAGLARGRR
jgi:hypothetical protein